MPSLLAFFGLDASKFSAGLDKAVAEAGKKGPSIEKQLLGGLKQSSIFNWIASPIGAASAAAVGFVGAIISKVEELRARAKEIKIGAAQSGLSQDQFQNVFNAAQSSGANTEAIPKAILKIAEAQEKVKAGGPGAAEALRAFSDMGITLAQVKNSSYQDLFLQIADSMHVAKLSGEQLTAGAELMGKGFESLLPAFQRGFNEPVDQMSKLSDEEITKLNNMNKSVAILKATWSTALQTIANAAVKVTGVGDKSLIGDADIDANGKRLQKMLDEQQAKKAKAANAGHQKELSDAEAQKKNLKEAAGINERTAEEERVAKLRAMPAPQRFAELQKETAELKRQASILEQKLKSEKDAADAPALAKLKAQIAKNGLEAAELSKGKGEKALSLTSNQKVGAFAGGVADRHLQVAQQGNQHLQRIDTSLQRLVENARKAQGFSVQKGDWVNWD